MPSRDDAFERTLLHLLLGVSVILGAAVFAVAFGDFL